MQRKRHLHAIVRVLDARVLIDPALGKQRFDAGRELIPGIYVVIWPPEQTAHFFDPKADYHGPFNAWEEAGAWLRRWREETRPGKDEGDGESRLQPGARSSVP